ncbi:MAG: PAS domain S-box protein, partial [Armatimonadetes bacterium]|nr:PAS domain S-box protein [Armatimonadota bacterium]
MKTEAKAVLFSLFLGVLAWFVSGLLRVLSDPSESVAQSGLVYRILTLNLPARLFVTALFLASGVITGQVLRQRRLAQDQLRASRARAQQLFDRAPDGMWEVGRDRVITQANEALCELAGVPSDAIIGQQCCDILRTPLCGTERCPVHQAEHGQPPQQCETAVTRPDGRQALCVIHSRPTHTPSGDLAGLIQSFRNVTEQRKAEARFQALVETTGDGVTVVDPEGRITYANEAFCEMLGYTEEELLGRVGASLCDEENQALLAEQLRRRPTGAEDRYELVYMARDGSPVDVLISATPLFDEQGTYAGSFAVMKNVTELKQAAVRTEHLNSVLRAIRNVNQLITREHDREALLQQACECLIETRGYGFAGVLVMAGEGKVDGAYAAGDGAAAPPWQDADLHAALWAAVSD